MKSESTKVSYIYLWQRQEVRFGYDFELFVKGDCRNDSNAYSFCWHRSQSWTLIFKKINAIYRILILFLFSQISGTSWPRWSRSWPWSWERPPDPWPPSSASPPRPWSSSPSQVRAQQILVNHLRKKNCSCPNFPHQRLKWPFYVTVSCQRDLISEPF